MANRGARGSRAIKIIAEEYRIMYDALDKIEGQTIVAHLSENEEELRAMLRYCYNVSTKALDAIRNHTVGMDE